MSRNPVTIQLRYLQTLLEVSNNQSSTIVLPLPLDVLRPLIASAQGRADAVSGPERERLEEALTATQAALDAATSDSGREAADQMPASR
jgi:hypothetical protein